MIKLLRTYLKGTAWWLIAIVALQLVATMASLYLPTLQAHIIDQGVAKGDTHRIWVVGGTMLGVTLIQILCTLAAVILGTRLAMRFGRDVRSAVFHRVLSWSTRELNRFGAPSLITRNTNDVQQVQQVVMMSCTLLVTAPIMMIGGIVMALREDIGLSWLIVVSVAVLAAVVGVLIAQFGPLFRRMQTQIDQLNRVLREQITGIRVVRAFVREDHEHQRFDDANHAITGTSITIGRLMGFLFPFVQLVLNVSSVGVLWFGAPRIDNGSLQVGQLMAFLQYLMQILMSVMMATMMMVLIPRGTVCANRINEVLDTDSTVVWDAQGRTDLDGRGQVSLRDVEFSYPGAESPVLRHISFDMLPGQTTAIIGSTGAGKSTLINLIPRLYDATAGTVAIDGVDVRDADPDTLWARIGLVPQKPYLFTGTIASNLRYGNPDATDEELWSALRTAQAEAFVRALPDGLETPISQGGTTVSGGQRQRLAIARALVKKPDIYVFDDSFSALDVTTDARLRAALAQETANAAVLIVAQRISTVTGADQILVLDDGEIVGRGTHDELLRTNPTYREIVDSQVTAEEAA